MAEEDTSQPTTSAPEPTATPPEAATAPVEPEATQSVAETPTAQIPASEPLPPAPEPIAPASEPPQAAASAPVAPTHPARDLLVKARATIQDRKRKKLDKILEYLDTKAKNGSTGSPRVTNDEVEKLLHVSDATATRYLSALEKEGKIQQVGRTGKAVEYTRN